MEFFKMEKGKFYYGNTGVGKTTRLQSEFDEFKHGDKHWYSARYIARIGQAHGLDGIQKLSAGYHIYIDDLGHETFSVSNFGTIITPVAEFIQERYDRCKQWPKSNITTHFTSNLSPEALRERYGDFVLDRLIEMCEWVHIEGDSFRK